MDDPYSYPKAFGGFMVGDKVTFIRGRSVYTITKIQVRNHDKIAGCELQGEKSKRYTELVRCKKVDR